MDIIRKKTETQEEYIQWLQSLGFTVEPYGVRYRYKYDLDETETWCYGLTWSQNEYQYVIPLYNHGILLTTGEETTISLPYYIAIAPEKGDDNWIINPDFISNITRNSPTFSRDSIELSDYYNGQEENMYNNLYYMTIIPYRNCNYYRRDSQQQYHSLSDHIQNYDISGSSTDVASQPCPYVAVSINEKNFLLLFGGSTSIAPSGVSNSGLKRTLALRID